MTPSHYFVTGTDTGIGKTTLSCLIIQQLVEQGAQVVGMKPVASGCDRVGKQLVSDDVVQLTATSNVKAPLEWINPYAFESPIAPHIAAKQSGSIIKIPTIVNAFKELTKIAEYVIVEGVGGFCVPLNETEDTSDLAAELGLPVIMVVGMRLGCLNHALLTAQSIRQKGLVIAGWYSNQLNPNMAFLQDNILALKERISEPYFGHIPYREKT